MYDLQLRFDLPGFEEEAESGLSPQDTRLISEAARAALEEDQCWKFDEAPTWFQDYMRFRELNWPWRVAGYITVRNQIQMLREKTGLNRRVQIAKWVWMENMRNER